MKHVLALFLIFAPLALAQNPTPARGSKTTLKQLESELRANEAKWQELAAEIEKMRTAQPYKQTTGTLVALPGGIEQAPAGETRDKVFWWISTAAEGVGTYLDWSSSWKQPAVDALHAEPSGVYTGRYYVRATVVDWSVYAVPKIAQFFLARKYPYLWSKFSYVNFGVASARMAKYGWNATNHYVSVPTAAVPTQ